MKDTQFIYAVSRVRSSEQALLNAQDMEQLLSLPDVDACLRTLGDKGWNVDETVEDMLRQETEKTWAFITEICDDHTVFDILLLRNDFHNLKTQIKSTLTGVSDPANFLHPAGVDTDLIQAAIMEKNFESLPPFMAAAAESAFEILVGTGDGQLTDIILDRAQMEAMISFGKASGLPFVARYAALLVALSNLKIAVRAQKTGKTAEFLKRALAPCDNLDIDGLALAAAGNRESLWEFILRTPYSGAVEALNKSFSAFEKWCDDKIIAFILDVKHKPFGVEPLFAYILARENEIKMVRIVLSGIHNDLSKNSIRERLRNLYV